MVLPPGTLLEIGGENEDEEKNLVDKLHANLEGQRTELNEAVAGEREEEEEEGGKNTPLRYVSLCDVYSATSPCVSSASGGSKKVKPPHHHHRKSLSHFGGHDHHPPKPLQLSSSTTVMNSNSSVNNNSGRIKPPITHFYRRRDKGKRKHEDEKGEKESSSTDMCQGPRFGAVDSADPKAKEEGFGEENGELIPKRRKKRKSGGYELANLGVGSTLIDRDRLGLREAQNTNVVGRDDRNKNSSVEICSSNINNSGKTRRQQKNKADTENEVKQSGSVQKKKWVWCDS